MTALKRVISLIFFAASPFAISAMEVDEEIGCRGAATTIDVMQAAKQYREAIATSRRGEPFDRAVLRTFGHDDPPPSAFIEELRGRLVKMQLAMRDDRDQTVKQQFSIIRGRSQGWIRAAKEEKGTKNAVLAGHILELQALAFLYASVIQPTENNDHLEEIAEALGEMRKTLMTVSSLPCLTRTQLVLRVVVRKEG